MEIVLRNATEEDFKVIENLVAYYIYDMSEYMGWDPNAEGRYGGCDDLRDYWDKPDHHPYVITVDGKISGFAMVRPFPDEKDRTEIGEFFVLRKYKGRGVGITSAVWLFDAHPGPWLIRVLEDNTGACKFWEKVIKAYTKGHFSQTTEQYVCPHSGKWTMKFYRFESRSQSTASHD